MLLFLRMVDFDSHLKDERARSRNQLLINSLSKLEQFKLLTYPKNNSKDESYQNIWFFVGISKFNSYTKATSHNCLVYNLRN